jgi:hypothetical protein
MPPAAKATPIHQTVTSIDGKTTTTEPVASSNVVASASFLSGIDSEGVDHINRLFARSKNKSMRQVLTQQTQAPSQPLAPALSQLQTQVSAQPQAHSATPQPSSHTSSAPLPTPAPVVPASSPVDTTTTTSSNANTSNQASQESREQPEAVDRPITNTSQFSLLHAEGSAPSSLLSSSGDSQLEGSPALVEAVKPLSRQAIKADHMPVSNPSLRNLNYQPAMPAYRSSPLINPGTPPMPFYSGHSMNLQQQQAMQHQLYQQMMFNSPHPYTGMPMTHNPQHLPVVNPYALQRGVFPPPPPLRQPQQSFAEHLQFMARLPKSPQGNLS